MDRLKDAVVYQSAIEALLSESKVQSEDVEASEVTRYVNLAMKETIMRYEDAIEEIILDVAPLATRFKGSFQVFNPTKRF